MFGMSVVLLIMIGIVLLWLLMYSVGLYNQLVQVQVNVDKAWSNIDVLLKQRYDEIPKLIKVCEGYMQYERDTLEKIVAARTRFMEAKTPAQAAAADTQMAGALKTLFAVSENYPELKANANFKQLQERISYLENQLADRREFYNESVAVFNARIRQIPDIFIARALNYQPREMFKALTPEKTTPEINFTMPQ
jgi:LemA protein